VPVNYEKLILLQDRVPKCLQELFPGKHILPHNIPSYLEGIITITNLPRNEVDLDVDISKLRSAVHKKAIEYLECKDYAKARNLFRSLCILDPSDPTPHYNLACTESLLGNVLPALTTLKTAVELGFSNLQHMRQDPDLENIRHSDEFSRLCLEMDYNQIPELNAPVSSSNPTPSPITIPSPTLVPTPTPIPESVPILAPVSVPAPTPAPVLVPVPVPVPAQVPELSAAQVKWATELSVLRDVGFINDEIIIPLLEINNGSVERTVLELLNM